MTDRIIEILKSVIRNEQRMKEIEETLRNTPMGKVIMIEIGDLDGDVTIYIRKGWENDKAKHG